MIRHNLLLIFRNFRRFKSTFFINLIGLSSGLACALMIYLWVQDELSMDKFHENNSRLYQVLKNNPQADGTIVTMPQTPAIMARAMAEDLPEIEYSVSVIQRDNSIITAGDRRVKALHLFADKDFFKVFSFQLIEGDEKDILSDKYGVLLSDRLAMKLFNTTENIRGKVIEWEWNDRFNGSYTVRGLFKSPPENSSLQFDLVFSHMLWIDVNKNDSWISNNASTFLTIKDGINPEEFREKIKNYSREKFRSLFGEEYLKWEGTLLLQKYSDRYLNNHFENGVQSGGKIEYVKLFSMIAAFILVIACINFMNLFTAKASRRVKEVGIKKAIGAGRKSLVFQYLSESFLISFLSLIIAIIAVELLLPQFNLITGKHLLLDFNLVNTLSLIGIAGITGLIAGSYPALYMSGFNPVKVLKGKLPTHAGEAWTRKGLVVFQFGISMILIVSVIAVYKQIRFIQTKNLGFDKDNIIRFPNEGNLRKKLPSFMVELKKIPGIVNASSMDGDLTGMHGGGGGIEWEGKDPNAGIEFAGFYVDYEMIEMLDVPMTSGRTFSNEFGSEKDKVILNETAVSMMGLKDPVGKTIKMWGQERQIIGIVKDFNYESLYNNVSPLFFAFSGPNRNTFIKIRAGMETEVLTGIKKLYQSFSEGLPFEYRFLDDDYQALYAAELRVQILSRYFAGLAILISSLGLFGLAAFTAERRRKEIGIRKVMGSTEAGIVRILSGDFIKLVFLAIMIAIPLSYILLKQWLEGFAYRIRLEPAYFIAAGLIAILIAMFTVGMQAIKASRINPAQCLKDE